MQTTRREIKTLPSGLLRARVYARPDPLTKERHYLVETVAAGLGARKDRGAGGVLRFTERTYERFDSDMRLRPSQGHRLRQLALVPVGRPPDHPWAVVLAPVEGLAPDHPPEGRRAHHRGHGHGLAHEPGVGRLREDAGGEVGAAGEDARRPFLV